MCRECYCETSSNPESRKAVIAKLRWTLLGRIGKDGHKIYRDEVSGRLAIADNSGVNPDQTDDGILWVDVTRALRVHYDRNQVSWFIPPSITIPLIVDRDNRVSRTAESLIDAPDVVRLIPDMAIVPNDSDNWIEQAVCSTLRNLKA